MSIIFYEDIAISYALASNVLSAPAAILSLSLLFNAFFLPNKLHNMLFLKQN